MNAKVKYWIELSDYDLETAIVMLKANAICTWVLCVTKA